MSAQVTAVVKHDSDTKVCQADFTKAAQNQLHGKLQLSNLHDKTTPLRGLDQAVLAPEVRRDLQTIIDYARISDVLFGQWGFSLHYRNTRGISALFHGPPGETHAGAADNEEHHGL